jgi:hypothetical protein
MDVNTSNVKDTIETTISYMDPITIVFGFVIMVLTILNYIRAKRELDRIKIVFKVGDKEILIDDNLTRKDCQRSEVQGILRTKLKKGVSHYDIDFLKKRDYFKNIYEIQKGKKDTLTIYIEPDELEKFDIKEV